MGMGWRARTEGALRQRAELDSLVARPRNGQERSVGYRSAVSCLSYDPLFRRSLDVQGIRRLSYA